MTTGAQPQRPLVSTSTGAVAGIRDEQAGQCRFLGIPYAEPPLGALRFMPTVPKRPWSGTLEVCRFGAASPQVFDPTEGNYEEFADIEQNAPRKAWVGAEDSLTLNIWTPAPDDKKRPVMVWIHGGANWLESSRLATYHGDNLVARGDVVFVSFNYRLGVFGFLDLGVLGGEAYKGSHSNGLRDQIVALRWIRENIGKFGGDPANITVMGESAGSMDISWLLTSGHLDGIARRIVMMSGVAGLGGLSGDFQSGFSEEYGQERARAFLSRMGIGSMQALLALSTDQVMERVTKVAQSADILVEMDSLFYPRTSADFAPVDPFRAAHSQGSRNIDVMIGYTAYEMGLWLFWDDLLDQRPCKWAAEKMLYMDAATQEGAVKLYGRCFAGEPPGTHGMHLLGDSIFVMPSLWFADALAGHGTHVWMYQFDKKTDQRRRALHAADQTYLFNKPDTHAGQSLLGLAKDANDRAARERLSAAMQDAVLAFARHGDPNAHKNPALPVWPAYSLNERSVLSFDTECRIINDPVRPRRLWWYDNVYRQLLG